MMKKKPRTIKHLLRTKRVAFGLVSIVVIAAVGILLHHSIDHPETVSGKIPTSTSPKSQAKSGAQAASNITSSGSQNGAASDSTGKYAPQSGSTDTVLTVPNGTFVSYHSPSLSGSEQQKAEQSTCNTNPGASCYIKFTQGSVVRTLTAQTTDSSGATTWNWDISTSGLTAGTWQVSAVASLDGQTQTATDPINLEVHP